MVLLDDESLTSANLGNDHGFINKQYSLHWYEAFWGSPKQSHGSLYSKWTVSYHCGESCSFNRCLAENKMVTIVFVFSVVNMVKVRLEMENGKCYALGHKWRQAILLYASLVLCSWGIVSYCNSFDHVRIVHNIGTS